MHLPAWRSRMEVHPMRRIAYSLAFYTSDKLLRLRQQKMYRMKKRFVTHKCLLQDQAPQRQPETTFIT